MFTLFSGPLFLIWYKVWHHFLQSKSGDSLQGEDQYKLLLTPERVTLHKRKDWKSLKESSFLVTFTLCLSLSLILFTLDSPEVPPTQQPEQGGPCSEAHIMPHNKSPRSENWNKEGMVRDGYRYKIERIPLTLVGQERIYGNDDGEYYFSEVALWKEPEQQEFAQLERKRIGEVELMEVLREIQREEEENCICPIFLGIRGNLSFLYYQEKEWVILFDPYVNWAPRDAIRVKKRVHFKEDSKFNGFLQEPHRRDLYLQYDRFTVTFGSPSLEGVKRISLPLEGKDAVCFIYCQNQQQEWGGFSLP